MFNAFDNVFEFLITIIFNLFIFVLLLRALMQWSGVHYLNPLAQLSIKLTDWCVKPLRLFLPIFYRVDSGIVLLVWFAEILKYICLLAFTSQSYPLAAIIVVSFFDILRLLINIFFYAIIIRAIISWLGQ
ncbi:MAG: YggT family protein, partial [Pseudomonadota bacterium]